MTWKFFNINLKTKIINIYDVIFQIKYDNIMFTIYLFHYIPTKNIIVYLIYHYILKEDDNMFKLKLTI